MENVNITEEEVKAMLDNETWLSYQNALEYGFATSVVNENNNNKASQSVKKSLQRIILDNQIKNKNQEAKEEPIESTQEPVQEPIKGKVNKFGSFFNAIIK